MPQLNAQTESIWFSRPCDFLRGHFKYSLQGYFPLQCPLDCLMHYNMFQCERFH